MHVHDAAIAGQRDSRRPAGVAVTRVDAWTWSVRLFKTRSAAASACRGGHVKINGATAKPAQPVVPGDEVRV
ncbi:S4 domain-containing protein, partial [Rhodococcoides kroppenstedtii]|uniref:S4 domain-containing protein n=1 Tax=Rhodococcoides kroppenstedtii TaxID=293050 RepID=UPI0035302813